MLSVQNMKVYSLSKDHLNLSWETADTSEDPYDYTFTVERSESQFGPFDQISEPFSDKYSFRDVEVNLGYRLRQYWYRIKITRKSDSTVTYSAPFTLGAKLDLIALEVRRQEYILFKEHIGRLCWVFPIRTFGQRCPHCYDIRTKKRLHSQCRTCFDTTYTSGYLDPIQSYIQIDPHPANIEPQTLGETSQANASARMLYFPLMKPRDIIVESENTRWRVVTVSTTRRLRAVLHQEIVLHRIPDSDIEYLLPVNVNNLSDFEASPEREFTNRQDL